jgi:hypothetical protein
MKKIAVVLILAVTFCFVLASVAQATDTAAGKRWARKNLKNKHKATSIPIWQITQDGTLKSVTWADHAPNPRFAVNDPGTPGDETDDVVLDKETGLVWARDANSAAETKAWGDAILYCRHSVTLGNRKGWRLPTIEELTSLLDPSMSGPALPSGHPFVNVQPELYWSNTSGESDSTTAWSCQMDGGQVIYFFKTDSQRVWPVRGGNGYATGAW